MSGIQLIIVGLLFLAFPEIAFGRGDTNDAFTNMMQKLPLNKVFQVRNIVLTGLLLLTLGLARCAGGGVN